MMMIACLLSIKVADEDRREMGRGKGIEETKRRSVRWFSAPDLSKEIGRRLTPRTKHVALESSACKSPTWANRVIRRGCRRWR
jgi:hypothetical protein